jgi:hypothetical protein
MKRATPLVAVLAALVLAGATAAGSTDENTSTPTIPSTHPTCSGKPVKFHATRARKVVRGAFAFRKWRKDHPWTRDHRRRFNQQRDCLLVGTGKQRAGLNRYKRQKRKAFERHKRKQEAKRQGSGSDCISGVTVYMIGSQCIAIPAYIVACESGGSWSAYNPSGAAGIYQIMPFWGRPFPVDSVEDKREHHRIAARIWNGGAGASNWVCA